MFTDHAIRQVVDEFQIEGALTGIIPYKSGHINETYLSTWKQQGREVHFIHQWINHKVFHNVPALMENIVRVTEHLRSKLGALGSSAPDTALSLIPSKKGGFLVRDRDGGYWRTYYYIENTETFGVCKQPMQAYEAAKAVGRFQQYLSDLAPSALTETIPYFHHTPHRYEALQAVIDKDPMGRCAEAKYDIDFALSRKKFGSLLTDGIASGAIPLRVVHNDTKLNNVLFDASTGKAICVVDLDTCMAGCTLYDFGDLVRNTSVPAAEDERDLSKVEMDIEFYRELVRGYIETMGNTLNKTEREWLPLAPRVMALTLGVRFLTDYLAGDVYFRTHRAGHNLDRCRAQFKIVASMEAQEGNMRALLL